jgi:heme oxygenase
MMTLEELLRAHRELDALIESEGNSMSDEDFQQLVEERNVLTANLRQRLAINFKT